MASCVFVLFVSSWFLSVEAHSGPPFPILEDRIAGAYKVSIWADPDATDDQTAAGKFWITLQPAARDTKIPATTAAQVSITPLDRSGAERSGRAEPLNGDVQRQYVAVLMDHEGRYGVRLKIEGPLGAADVRTETDATYDLRPRPILTLLFVAPFLLVGFVWGKLLITRKMAAQGATNGKEGGDRREPEKDSS
ncbi:MAG TPA: hypothetical protein VFP91_17985 [Vicinamibacterales bacterium]|nr:hypothetical protein [Vicinamibacterales bacterium]